MATVEAAWAAAATLVAAAFALSTLERWLARRRLHELAWTVSLALFTLASGALWWGAAAGWGDAAGEWAFRVFYLFGAILNVPWLALGSVALLAGAAVGRRLLGGLALFSTFAAGVLVAVPLQAALPAEGLPEGRLVFPVPVRVMAGLCSGVSALVIIGLALLSAWRLVRGRQRSRAAGTVARPGRLALGNVLIATGTLVLSASGTLNARFGEMTAFAVTLAVGVLVLFLGFLVATSATAVPRAPAGRRPPEPASPVAT
jgi:hypothetical protein